MWIGAQYLEDEARHSDVSGVDHQNDALEGQFSEKVEPVAEDQVSLYSFLRLYLIFLYS